MAVALMTLAFKAAIPSTQKLVLLALADAANDQGECYPSLSKLVEKCSLSDRAIQTSLQALEDAGHMHREFRTGRSTTYWIHPRDESNPRSTFTPERRSPPKQVHPTPEAGSPPPPNDVHPTPERPSPITIKETNTETPHAKRAVRPEVVPVSVLVAAGFDARTAQDFIDHKARSKSPLTSRAWADHQREAGKAGWTVMDAAEKVMAKNWRGFEARYVEREAPPSRRTATNPTGVVL